ncbi:DUF1569 domain-containing protein [Mucilaginibacter aquariorum]|uniref:DUF1569 domain-containing protein n=1 Tax=Mucilaginibacter aquariorum TaxID=2967225 RepID=A0ABT1TAC7_9SPHI|nr:DUF1569 domain-containing protein [Mucilaginibacter aquariorum]MCQ6961592.1 DUF1569 domain-containing protein [Mucilaginibacter aquariorum]
MKTIFDKATRDGLINRINALNENNSAEWGKMTAYQMVKHCVVYEDMMLGKKPFKRVFLGYIFGKWALKTLIRDESPLKRNMPSDPGLIIKDNYGDVASEKKKWIALIEEYGLVSNYGIMHPFFGKITKEQIGYLVYKHTDHHLRQFKG